MTGDTLQHVTLNNLMVQAVLIESGLIALFLYCKGNRSPFYYFFSLGTVFIAVFFNEMMALFPLYAVALLFFLTDLDIRRMSN